MKRIKIPGIIDTIVVDDPAQINALSEDPRIDRLFKGRPLQNGLFLQHLLRVLSYRGMRFPHMMPRKDAGRASRQDQFWELFSLRAARMADGPEELEDLSRWIKGQGPAIDPGILVQQLIGSFFSDHYVATADSWAAAVTINTAAHSQNPFKTQGRVKQAKQLLASMVNNDIIALHGTAIALHNMVASVHTMKEVYADKTTRPTITPEAAAGLCLSAPPVVFRQATSKGQAGGCPFSKYSMFQFKLRDAYKHSGAKDMLFMSNSWSRCPAEKWVPAVLAGIWIRACK